MTRDFPTQPKALAWAIRNAWQCCGTGQIWRVILVGRAWAVGVYERDGDRFSHYAV
jgi:hypothetical protein